MSTKAELETLLKEQKKEIEELKKSQEKREITQEGHKDVLVEKGEEKVPRKEFDIRPDDYVEIISLCPNALYLSISPNDDTPIIFEGVGESQHVTYADLVKYITRHRRFAKEGVFYIVDQTIVRRHRLETDYKKVLKKEEIEEVVSGNPEIALRLFEGANDTQREFIIDIFVKKIVSDKNFDKSLVYHLGKIVDKDIYAMAEQAKEFEKII